MSRGERFDAQPEDMERPRAHLNLSLCIEKRCNPLDFSQPFKQEIYK